MMFVAQDVVRVAKMRCKIVGDATHSFNSFVPIDKAHRNGLCFCVGSDEKSVDRIVQSRAEVIICHEDITIPDLDKTLIKVENPRLAFIRFLNSVHEYKARIDPSASINDCVSIGKNVTIKPGCVIGYEGFSFEKNENGGCEHFPHLGGVIIEDDVFIGANACIDRGTLTDTVIGKGTQIGNLVHIGHNVITGENSVICAAASVHGGAHIEEGAWIAPGARIRDTKKVGARALVGMGAVVVKDVEGEDIVMGVPARSKKHRNGVGDQP